MNQDDLHNAMHGQVDDIRPSRERLHAARLDAANRRRRRDTFTAGVTGCVLTVMVAVGVVSLHGNGNGSQSGTNENEVVNLAAQVEATSPAAPTAASDARSGLLVGAAASGRLVQIDPVSGKTTKLISDVTDPSDSSKGGLLGHVAISPDSKTVYFDRLTADACNPEIDSISAAGGTATKLAAGSEPALSSDGKFLAFVTNACSTPQVLVENISTKATRVVVNGNGDVAPTSISNLSWSPDGKQLLLDTRYAQSSSDTLAIAIATQTSSYTALRALTPPPDNPGTVWEWGSYLSDGRIFLSERCCTTATAQITNKTSELVVIDPNNPGSTLIAYGVTSKTHSSTGQDASGNQLFYLSGTDLMASDNQQRPAPLAYGLIGAAWR